MTEQSETYDFVVVGAGPVGMTAAALLSADGATVLVIERNPGTSDAPKAISIDDEALRTYAWAGIAQRLMSIIVPGTGTRYYDAEGELVFQAGAELPYRLGFPFKNPFAQPDLERLLLDVLTERPNVDVRFGARLQEIERNDALGAVVRYATSAGSRRAVGRFLLGADGGRSTVRALLGIELVGKSYEDDWLVVDVLGDHHRERFGMHHGDPARPHVIVPGLDGRCRYEFLLRRGEATSGDTPSLELIREVLAPYRTIEPHQVERAVVYRFHGLIATRWRSGGAFLLGDAAHMMPPFAGQGLNSGIRDAANLCWKLIEVLNGGAPEAILDSYQTERYAHALATIRLSERLGRVVMTTSPRLAAARDSAVRAALATHGGREFFEYMRYRPAAGIGEGLVLPDADLRVGTQLAQPLVFDVASHEVRQLDAATGRGWILLAVGDVEPLRSRETESFADSHGIRRFDVPLAEVLPHSEAAWTALIDIDGRLARELRSFQDRFVLVRPDHVIAAAWSIEQAPAALAALGAWWRPAPGDGTSEVDGISFPPHHEKEKVS